MRFNSVIFDWKRTLYDPESRRLMTSVTSMLEFLKLGKVKIYLIGKGGDDMLGEVKRIGIKDFFEDTIFVNESKEEFNFEKFIDKVNSKNTLVVGDRLNSELAIGNRLGTTTVFIQQGKFADEKAYDPKNIPDFVFGSIQEFYNFIKT